MVASVALGRGAWTKIGKGNTSRYYTIYDGIRVEDVNSQAVNLGVKAIQNWVNALGYAPKLELSGIFGPKTQAGVKWAQVQYGFTGASVDGVVGPATSKKFWSIPAYWFAAVHKVPVQDLWGFVSLESAFDAGAVGYTTPSDRGLFQINLVAHPTITVDQAFDVGFAANYTAERLAKARAQFAGKGEDLQRKCSIAQHNSPLQAKQWYTTGTAPSEQIALYVARVLDQGSTFKF